MKKNLTRRESFTRMAGSAIAMPRVDSIVTKILCGVLQGLVSKAMAEEGGSAQPNPYVVFSIPGGLPQWAMFPLQPYSGMNVSVPSGSPHHMINAFNGTGAGIYSTQNISISDSSGAARQLRLPPFWSTTMPRPGGLEIPMIEAMKHHLCVRGVYTLGDNHGFAYQGISLPVPGGYSIGGMVTQKSERSFPAVGGYNSPAYRSPNGAQEINYGTYSYTPGSINPVQNILASFNEATISVTPYARQNDVNFKAYVDGALKALDDYIEERNPGAAVLSADRKRAKDLFDLNFNNVISDFDALYAKYADLIERSKGLVSGGPEGQKLSVIPGVTNQSSIPMLAHQEYVDSELGAPIQNPDMRSIISDDSKIYWIAAGFAASEYLIKNRLTHYASMASDGQYHNMNFKLNPDYPSAGTVSYPIPAEDRVWAIDEHTGGSVPSLLIHLWVYRAVMASVYELFQQTRSEGTVIQFASEFLRNAHLYGGSDHAWQGSAFYTWSPELPELPLILGNLQVNSGDATHPGTWKGAPVLLGGQQRLIGVDNIAATLAVLLKTASAAPNALPVLARQGDALIPLLGNPENL